MAKSLFTFPAREKKTRKLIARLLLPMLSLVILQLVVFFGILAVGGEFTYVQHYAYSTLVDKTETRKNYIESEFQQKIPPVHESSERIKSLIDGILAEQGATIADLQKNKDLTRNVLESSVDIMVDLLRRNAVNDVYLILDTGDLYSVDNGSTNAKAALYLRDLDTMTDAGYSDLLMEVGLTSIAQKYGIILDSGWSLHFEPDPNSKNTYDFYYKTIETAQEQTDASLESLGYWSGFSGLSHNTAESMKYTVPLIADDGAVYGVLGIGLTENTILTILPSNDFMSETACYVLGRTNHTNSYDVVIHSGAAFNSLVGGNILYAGEQLDEGVHDFRTGSSVKLAGSIQPVQMYNGDSPYAGDQWVLISIADRGSVLQPLNNILRLLFSAAAVSVFICIVVIILSSRGVVRPISDAIKIMNSSKDYNEVVRFQPSHIFEIDKMTDAITQLQVNVQDYSSQVSQMIRIADVGLGTFMYNRLDDTVFIGQSLLELLNIHTGRNEDVTMSRKDFIASIPSDETRQVIAEALDKANRWTTYADYIREYSYQRQDGSTNWLRLSLVNNQNKSIGILQDITGVIMEKKRIEYERDYDSTTGLLNRRAYNQQLAELFHNKDALKTTAIIMLDLDNLKFINDTYGHDFGDEYIKTAGNMLKRFQAYGGIVSRLSGDEFNVCLPGFNSKDEVRAIIDEVRGQLLESSCLLADGTHFKVRASMGVAWYPDDAQAYDLLMRYADYAMYTIKHGTKGEIAEFDMATYTEDSTLLTGVQEATRIIDERRVRYAFQGIISTKTGRIYGYEALMRPQSSIFQSHLELLRTAKTGSKLYELEQLTWTKALDDFQAQIDAGHIAGDSHIFINSIASCVLNSHDISAVEAAHMNLLPQVVMEILEIENLDENCLTLKRNCMQKWNAQIALDDFGISYNNEAALSSLQPNIIKIDRSIINGCDKDISRCTIINNLVRLARSKQMLVLAGGVETEEELRTVISCDVDLVQGYYLSRPLFEPQPLAPELVTLLNSLVKPDKNA